jgi:hypothetical protein
MSVMCLQTQIRLKVKEDHHVMVFIIILMRMLESIHPSILALDWIILRLIHSYNNLSLNLISKLTRIVNKVLYAHFFPSNFWTNQNNVNVQDSMSPPSVSKPKSSSHYVQSVTDSKSHLSKSFPTFWQSVQYLHVLLYRFFGLLTLLALIDIAEILE